MNNNQLFSYLNLIVNTEYSEGYKLKYMILVFSFITSGCGSYANNIKNCIPQAEFISSVKYQFASRFLIDRSLKNSFDPLDVSNSNKDEYFKSRKVKDMTNFPNMTELN